MKWLITTIGMSSKFLRECTCQKVWDLLMKITKSKADFAINNFFFKEE